MAVQFTANGDSLISIQNGTQFYRGSQQAQSISVWINALWNGNVQTSSYVGMYSAVTGTAIQIGCKTALGQCDIWTWGGATLVSTTGIIIPSSGWSHLVYTFDATTHRIYYNGALNNSANTAQIAGNFDKVWLNGYRGGGAAETATFQLDTYEYFDRALSLAEIQTMYATRGTSHGIVQGSILRYEFDNGAVGSDISTILNETDYPKAISDLSSENLRTPKATFSPGYISHNLRPPQV